jgi:tape measure domain-containing protein
LQKGGTDVSGVEWVFNLLDRLSGPARRMESAMRRFNSTQELATRGTARLSSGLLSLRGAGSVVMSVFERIRGAISSVFSLPGLIAGGAVAAGIKSIIDAAGYKEQQLIGFTTMLKDGQKAAQLYANAVKFADETPFDTVDVLDATKKMLAFQFSTRQIPRIMTAAGDAVSSLGGGAAELQGLITAFGQIRAKGKLSSEELNQFAERGIPAVQFLADKLKTDTAGALKLVEKGAVSSQVAITAITEGMEKAFGGGMAKQARSIFGLVSTLRSRPFKLFSNLDQTGALEPVRGLLENLANLTNFDKAPGSRIKDMFNRSVGGLFKAVFGGAEAATRGAAGEQFVSNILSFVDRISSFITREGPGIAAGFKTVFGAVSWGLSLAVTAAKLVAPYVPALVSFFAVLKGAALLVSLKAAMVAVGGFAGVLPALGTALTALGGPWTLLIAAIVAGVVLIVTNWSKIRPVVQPVLDWLAGAFRTVMNFFSTLPAFFSSVWNNVVTVFTGAINFLAQFPFTPLGALAFLIKNFDQLPAIFSSIWSRVTGVFNGVMNWFATLPQRFAMLGAQLIIGLVNGITSRINSVRDAVVGAAEGAIGWFKGVLGIKSPSRVFEALGAQLPAGLERGIMSGQKMVSRAVTTLGAAAAVTGAVAVSQVQPASSAVAAGAGRAVTLNVNVKGEPGTSQATLEAYREMTVEAFREALEMEELEVRGG